MSARTNQLNPFILIGLAFWAVVGFAFASGWFSPDDPALGPLTDEERARIDEVTAATEAEPQAPPELTFAWDPGVHTTASVMTSVTVVGDVVTASSVEGPSSVTVTRDDAGNLKVGMNTDYDAMQYTGDDSLLRQWVESPANDVVYTVSPEGLFLGPFGVLERALWESGVGGALALADEGESANCQPGQSPIGTDGGTVIDTTLCRRLSGPLPCPNIGGDCLVFEVLSTPDHVALLELINEHIPSAQDLEQAELARLWLTQDGAEPVAGDTLFYHEYRAEFGSTWQNVQSVRRTFWTYDAAE